MNQCEKMPVLFSQLNGLHVYSDLAKQSTILAAGMASTGRNPTDFHRQGIKTNFFTQFFGNDLPKLLNGAVNQTTPTTLIPLVG